MAEPAPWDQIGVPVADYNVRQAAEATPVPCFWGRDPAGSFIFIMELIGDHAEHFKRTETTARGIRVDLRDGDKAGTQRLVITLEQQVNRDLFEGLCRTMLRALASTKTDSLGALDVALTHIQRWKTFLSGRGAQQLRPEEVRGLFAELAFLLELLDKAPSSSYALDAWRGPESSHQDFIFGNTAVEIKSVSGVERSAVTISSEDQLESLNDRLFLRVYRLSELAAAANARSLNDIVVAVQSRLLDAGAVESFDRKLMLHRYAPMPEYDEPRFAVSEVKSYSVVEGFPRIIRSMLPAGIMKVKYDIKLESIAAYGCENSDTLKEI